MRVKMRVKMGLFGLGRQFSGEDFERGLAVKAEYDPPRVLLWVVSR